MSKTAAQNPKASERRCIVDYKLKYAALEVLFGTRSRKEIAAKVLGNVPYDDLMSLVGMLGKYDKSGPGIVGGRFADGVTRHLQGLGSTERNLKSVFLYGTYKAFYNAIPVTCREAVRAPDGEQAGSAEADHFHHAWFKRDGVIETARAGFDRGRLDHKLYYLSPDAAEIWRQVIDAGEYRQYEDCVESYELLVESEVWRTFFRASTTDGLVMLGGGSATKDKIAIRSILALTDRVLHYAVVDYSHPMLMNTFADVDTTLRHERLASRVKAEPVFWDFMELPLISEKLRRIGNNVAWCMPGGTIGNLNEKHLFTALAGVAQRGDLFVVAAETLSDADNKDARRTISEKYDIKEVKRFLEAPIRSVWHELGLQGSIEDVLNQIRPRMVQGATNHHSAVPRAETVELALTVRRRQIVLLTSTRYQDAEFESFAGTFGFCLECKIASKRNPRFKQFVYRFDPRSGH